MEAGAAASARWPVAAMPLAPSARASLTAAGLTTAGDVAAFCRRAAADAAANAANAAPNPLQPEQLARALEAEGALRPEDAGDAAAALLAWLALGFGGGSSTTTTTEAARRSVCARLPPAMHPPSSSPLSRPPLTAAEMLRRERARRAAGHPSAIPTGSAALDALLAGARAAAAAAAAEDGGRNHHDPHHGVPLGRVTEFVGAPGVGKTQLAMTLAVNAVLLLQGEEGGGGGGEEGGNGGNGIGGRGRGNGEEAALAEALYLDTEGSFTPERVADIAAAAVERRWRQKRAAMGASAAAAGGGSGGGPGAAAATMPPDQKAAEVEAVMGRVHWFRARDDCDMLALWHMLPALLDAHPRARLVVADSVAAPLRQHPWTADAPARARLLAWLAQSACALAEARGAAFVLVNQVVTRAAGGEGEAVGGGGGGGGGAAQQQQQQQQQQQRGQRGQLLAPALGEAWGQAAAVRVSLAWEGPVRVAALLKHPGAPPGEARYAVADGGITDVWG